MPHRPPFHRRQPAFTWLRVFCLCAVLFLAPLYATSQSVSIDAELRPRAEFRDGFKKPIADTLNPEFVITQRSRLNLDYKSNSLNARITMQDVRTWGQSDTKSNTSKIELYEAWAALLLNPGLALQAGRQVLSYDDGRLFSASPWNNGGITHDAILLRYRETGFQVHGLMAYGNTNDTLFQYPYSVRGMYQTMGLLWLSREVIPGFNISVIGVGEGLQKTANPKPTVGRFTEGLNATYQNDSATAGGTIGFYDQQGRDANFKDLHSYLVAFKGNLSLGSTVTVQGGYDYISGTAFDADTAHESRSFNKLYGTNHSFNGSMEYWTTPPIGGLTDIYAGVTFKPDPALFFTLTGHQFGMPCDMKDKTGSMIGSNLGTEADFQLTYIWSKEVTVQGGWSMYFPTSATLQVNGMFDAKKQPIGVARPQWLYIMLTVKPTFFKAS